MGIKMYKGFNKDMKCLGFQYAEGETYHEDEAALCQTGFHACENPLDCFGYYTPGDGSIYREVELEDVSEEREAGDTKRVGKTIKIGAELDVAGICKAHFEYVKEHCNPVDGRVGGDKESVAVGDKASASAGFRGSASAGNYGSAVSRGSASVAANGVAVVRGNGVKVKGGLGSLLVIAIENDNNFDIKEWKAVVVDGKNIKADTWYTLKNKLLVEVE